MGVDRLAIIQCCSSQCRQNWADNRLEVRSYCRRIQPRSAVWGRNGYSDSANGATGAGGIVRFSWRWAYSTAAQLNAQLRTWQRALQYAGMPLGGGRWLLSTSRFINGGRPPARRHVQVMPTDAVQLKAKRSIRAA